MSAKDIRTVWTRRHNELNYGQQVYVLSEGKSKAPDGSGDMIEWCRVEPVGRIKTDSRVSIISKNALYAANDTRLNKGCSYEDAYYPILRFGNK